MDYSSIIVALIVTIPPSILAYLAWRSSEKVGKTTSQEIKEVHVQINSRMSELLEAWKKASKAQGKEEGKIEEREEVAERKKVDSISKHK